MTAGTYISDSRSNVTLQYFNTNLLVGEYFSKQWTGGDGVDLESKRREHSYLLDIAHWRTSLVQWTDNGTVKQFGANNLWPSVNWNALDAWSDNDSLKLNNKVGNKARGHTFNGGEFLAEAHQPIRMINDAAHRLASFLYGVKKRDFAVMKQALLASRGLKGTAHADVMRRFPLLDKSYNPNKVRSDRLWHYITSKEAIASDILAVQYGVRPLLSDMYSGAEAVANLLSTSLLRTNKQRVKARRTRKVTEYVRGNGCDVLASYEVRKEIRAILLQPPSFSTLMSINNPLYDLWAVTWLSFVFDWTLHLSDFLEAHGNTRNFEWGEVWQSDYSIRTVVQAGMPGPTVLFPQGTSVSYPFGKPFERYVTVKREYQGWREGISHLPTPSFNKRLVPEHWLNGLALLVGLNTSAGRIIKH